jgi:hypothetical protein
LRVLDGPLLPARISAPHWSACEGSIFTGIQPSRAPARIGTEITPLEYRILYRDSLAIILGSRAISDNSTTAAPVGCRRHCSQFRSVLTDTPIDSANAAWVTPTPPALSLMAATSITFVRLGKVKSQVQFVGPSCWSGHCGCGVHDDPKPFKHHFAVIVAKFDRGYRIKEFLEPVDPRLDRNHLLLR